MAEILVTVVVPTLHADARLAECLDSLARQTLREREVIVVDNSGAGLVRAALPGQTGVRVIENERNLGFGTAVNQGIRASSAPFVAVLNDDAAACPGWLEALVAAARRSPEAGMFASQVRLAGDGRLDSAGMLMCGDASGKQRGHLRPPSDFAMEDEALFPSGSAALYRRRMLDEIGLFDDDFFLYCEDVDLGLRGRWGGWTCRYVPEAAVEHHYSHSAGGASPLKAYYVERNRLFVLFKNFPAPLLARAFFVAAARYFWHLWHLPSGRGTAARYRAQGHGGAGMAWFVARAHWETLRRLRSLWRKRCAIRARARISPRAFSALLAAHSIGARQVAEL